MSKADPESGNVGFMKFMLDIALNADYKKKLEE